MNYVPSFELVSIFLLVAVMLWRGMISAAVNFTEAPHGDWQTIRPHCSLSDSHV